MKDYSRYARQYILKEIGREGQERLDRARVAVIGVGALGSVAANLLARAGVGTLVLIDRDYLESNNLQRQVLYDEMDVKANLPKAEAAARRLRNVNSEIRVEAQVSDLNAATIDALLHGVDLVIDGTDNFETRFLINDYALKSHMPWIYGGAVRTEGMSYVVLPGQGPCLRCLFGQAPGAEDVQTCDQVGILAPVAHLIASFQAVEAIKILAGHGEAVDRQLWKVDLWNREFKAVSVGHFTDETRCSGCREKDYPYLDARAGARAVALCGRNAVQINPDKTGELDFKSLADRLSPQGEVIYNEFLLRCRMEPYEITVFVNGRAIVRGTEDAGQAKSLYARYIGL